MILKIKKRIVRAKITFYFIYHDNLPTNAGVLWRDGAYFRRYCFFSGQGSIKYALIERVSGWDNLANELSRRAVIFTFLISSEGKYVRCVCLAPSVAPIFDLAQYDRECFHANPIKYAKTAPAGSKLHVCVVMDRKYTVNNGRETDAWAGRPPRFMGILCLLLLFFGVAGTLFNERQLG